MTNNVEFSITNIIERTMLDEAGNPQEAYRVFFDWDTGRTGHVDIPKSRATTEYRDTLIEAEIERQSTLWS